MKLNDVLKVRNLTTKKWTNYLIFFYILLTTIRKWQLAAKYSNIMLYSLMKYHSKGIVNITEVDFDKKKMFCVVKTDCIMHPFIILYHYLYTIRIFPTIRSYH